MKIEIKIIYLIKDEDLSWLVYLIIEYINRIGLSNE